MFFSHMPELMLVLVLALVVFGPKRLPEIGAGMGKAIRDFKQGISEVHESATGLPHAGDD
jgi:sec-independent protein translocase protein TatA